jgi:cobalamin biosynthesis Co2+ chelatase CbiK
LSKINYSTGEVRFEAGFHARRDMARKRDSVQAILDGMGFETECILRGMAEIEDLRELFLRPLLE